MAPSSSWPPPAYPSDRPTDRPQGPPTERVPPLTPADLEWPEERVTAVECPEPPGRPGAKPLDPRPGSR